jgi:hypothetical protein
MSEKIIIDLEIQEEDIKRMWRFLLWESPERKKYRTQKTLLSAFSCLFGFAFSLILISKLSNVESLFLVIMVVFAIVFSIGYSLTSNQNMGASIEQKASKFLSSSENKNMLGKQHYEFDEEKIYGSAFSGEINYFWNGIIKIVTSNDDYYLHINSQNAILIPHKVFKTNEERNTFENLLRSKMTITDYRTKNPNE